VLRESIQVSTQLATSAYDAKDDPEALVDEALERMRALKVRLLESDASGLAPRSLAAVLDQVELDLQAGPPQGVVGTPFPSVNQFLAGGFHQGELVLLGGYAGFGKTAMAMEVATATGARGNAVLVISREMLVEALARRMLSQHSNVAASSLRSGNLDELEWSQIREALPRLRGLPVWLTDRAASISQIEAMVRLERERHDLKLLVVDYLQLVRGPRGIGDKRLEVEHVSGALKALAQEHRIVVLALSAMSRRERGAGNRRPTIADLRETGRLEHDADIILLGHRPDMSKQETELIIAKGRGNATGTVELLFFGHRLTFEEKSIREPGEEPVPF
jgi:replicative DNA helicase